MSHGVPRFLPIFVPILLLAACGKSKETCQRESADLAAMFAGMDTRRGIETRFVKLVRRDDLPIAADEFGAVLELSAEGVRTWGVTETPSELQVVLERLLQNGRREKLALLLAIDAATPWSKVAEVFTSLEKRGVKDVGIVFARKPIESTPPARSSIDAKLDEAVNADPSDRATKMAQLASELVRECESINTLFASLGGGEDKTKFMIDGLPPALVECRCKCDVPALKSLMYRLLVNRAPTTTFHVALGGEELALRAELPWSEASQQLKAGRTFTARAYTHPELPPPAP